jgi:hypothetical protein
MKIFASLALSVAVIVALLALASNASDFCSVCLYDIELAEIYNQKGLNTSQITDTLYYDCANFKGSRADCKRFALFYAPTVIEYVVENNSSTEACVDFGFCEEEAKLSNFVVKLN